MLASAEPVRPSLRADTRPGPVVGGRQQSYSGTLSSVKGCPVRAPCSSACSAGDQI